MTHKPDYIIEDTQEPIATKIHRINLVFRAEPAGIPVMHSAPERIPKSETKPTAWLKFLVAPRLSVESTSIDLLLPDAEGMPQLIHNLGVLVI